MIVVTAGAKFLDVDAYACINAYAELLQMLGKDAAGVSTAPLNESIPASLRRLATPMKYTYTPVDADTYVLLDVSDPSQFDTFVDAERVIEVFDHHAGFENYWAEKIGEGCHIEHIGAAATLVCEEWVKAGKQDQMSKVSAMLLAAAILDNTLNFKAHVATDRDNAAFAFLAKHAGLNEAWVAQYFSECQASIVADLEGALRTDSKYFRWNGLAKELTMGQLALWDAQEVLKQELPVFGEYLRAQDRYWLVNLISISEGKSYFVAEDPAVQTWLHNLIGVQFSGSVAAADHLWLRKEVLKAALEVKPTVAK